MSVTQHIYEKSRWSTRRTISDHKIANVVNRLFESFFRSPSTVKDVRLCRFMNSFMTSLILSDLAKKNVDHT